MKKTKVTFIPIDGSGALHLDFQAGPFGDAVEAKRGDGIGFFSPVGSVMGVTFDDVNEEQDQQTLEFKTCKITVKVKKGSVEYDVVLLKPSKKLDVLAKKKGLKINRRKRKSLIA